MPVPGRKPGAPSSQVSVVDFEGNPIEAVQLSWSPVVATGNRLAWGPAEIDKLLAATLFVFTDASGIARFSGSPPPGVDAAPSVLWATKPGFAPAYIGLGPGEAMASERFQLQTAGSRLIRVLDPDGNRAPGASVLQFGLWTEDVRSMGSNITFAKAGEGFPVSMEAACMAFVRRLGVDTSGQTSLAHGGFPTMLLASRGDQASPLALDEPNHIALTLRLAAATFWASGRVTAAEGSLSAARPRVQALWSDGGNMTVLGLALVDESGIWGPLELPWQPRGSLEFRLFAGDTYATPIVCEFPARSGKLLVDFQASQGLKQTVRVIDEHGDPVPNARVRILWRDDGAWCFSEAWTAESGLAGVPGFKPSASQVEVVASGYQPNWAQIIGMPLAEPMTLVLLRAASIVGRVTFEGEPVSDFLVLYWVDDDSPLQRVYGQDSLDGQFSIRSAPFGRISMMAASADHAESAVQWVTTTSGEESSVDLELLAGAGGGGRVVDGATGVAISSATIELGVSVSNQYLGQRQDPVAVDAGGYFELVAVGAQSASIRVRAPGYVQQMANATFGADGQASFGVISMAKYQTLKVSCSVSDRRITEGLQFWLDGGPTQIAGIPVPETGWLEIDRVAPGHYSLGLLEQSRKQDSIWISDSIWITRHLHPGEDWQVLFPWGGGKSLEIHARMADGSDVPYNATVQLSVSDEADHTITSIHSIPPSGVRLIEGLPDADLLVTFFLEGATLDLARISLAGPGPHSINLVGCEAGLVVKFLGIPAEEYPACRVKIAPVGLKGWVAKLNVNPEGVVRTHVPPTESMAICLIHPSYGFQGAIHPVKSEGEQSIEFEVTDPYSVQIVAQDASGPVSGVKWVLYLAQSQGIHFGVGFTDAEGSTGELLLGEGTFTLTLSRNGYWHVEHDFEVSPPGGRMEFAIRRLGNLAVAVLDGAGNRVPGGRLTSEAVQLVSDATGGANLVGLPHGQYRWSCSLPGGTTAGGVCTIPPGEWGQLEIRLEL